MSISHVIVWARRLANADDEARKRFREFTRHARHRLPPGFYSGRSAPKQVEKGCWTGYGAGRDLAFDILANPMSPGWVIEVITHPHAPGGSRRSSQQELKRVRKKLAESKPDKDWIMHAIQTLIPCGVPLDDPDIIDAIEATDAPTYWRGACAREAVSYGTRLDDPAIVAAIEASHDPAQWWGACALAAVRRWTPIDDPAVVNAINSSNNPDLCRGECAYAAVRRGAALDDPAITSAISSSNNPDYWRRKCNQVVTSYPCMGG